ncbi:excinuclease ABC subunit UvrC [Allobaculum mucilyticum]|uniref:excinuclease ABC subunit UvrC n=1 Tax=Allobaculum mucilyticum TaxID=2834459 RepID=UPI001E57E864|nr:excinuclease ABC subunit UvrC [Allobaculum mucilyticum]UNT95811.1 excinuclease ABC subunit UvrC [Allobaculum mucilyticum]
MPLTDHIQKKLELLPDGPGCYIMKDASQEILYVGKAKVLKNRVRSYFHGVHNNKTTKLVARIEDFEFIRTSTEKEALLLEINLIKKYRPPFNIMFMDDKMYPYIEVTKGADFAVRITRTTKSKKSDYFGPYPVSTYAYDMVKLINQLFPMRKCRTMGKAPCLYYHMHQCPGFCFKEVDEKEALARREKVIRFLKGYTDEVKGELTEKMGEAAESLQFERAAELREQIRSIDYIQEKQTIDFSIKENFDVFGWYEDKGYISFQGFFVREGKLLERNMSVTPIYEESDEAFVSYIVQYYQTNKIPRTIYVPAGTDVEALEEALSTKVIIPQRGDRKKLVDLACANAKEAHEQKFQLVYRKDRELDSANRKLSSIFGKPVHTVELFDNSHISGSYNVSGLVAFKDGKPDKSNYRKYQLDGYRSDTDSMKEAVMRRYSRLQKEGRPMPDLLLVDGGIGQIHAARQVLDELGVHLTLAGLVKDDKHSTRALLNEDLEEIPLEKTEPLFFLLTRMQDEVHRFAITYHQQLRAKGMTKSVLDDVPGIGPKRKKQIQSAFPSLKKMRAATFADFEQYLPEKTAALLYTRLHEHDEQADEGIDAVQELDETVSAELPAETEQTDHPDAEAGKGETV